MTLGSGRGASVLDGRELGHLAVQRLRGRDEARRSARTLIVRDGAKKYELDDILDKIVQGDCIEVMRRMPPEIADMVFFDPPYFLQLPKKRLTRWGARTEVRNPEEAWDRFESFEHYDDFIRRALEGVRRLMKPRATIWAIGTYHNIFRIGKIMQDLGFWILNDVVWFKPNPMPNWLGVRLTNATENIIWAVKRKGTRGYTFNKEIARKYAEEDSARYRRKPSRLSINVWHIPICAGRERLKRRVGGRIESLHPTQKPEELLERMISISTKPGDTVFDPMAGTGTTGAVAKRLGRHFVMIEKSREYAEAAAKRLGGEL